MTDKLMPCPFCGHRNVVEIGLSEPGRDIYCPGCQASVAWTSDSKADVPAAWNRRAAASFNEAEIRAAALEEAADIVGEVSKSYAYIAIMTLAADVRREKK